MTVNQSGSEPDDNAKHQYANCSLEQQLPQRNRTVSNPTDDICSVVGDKGGGCRALGTTVAHRKGHRRQESMYQMTGLYSEINSSDDSSIDSPQSVLNPDGSRSISVMSPEISARRLSSNLRNTPSAAIPTSEVMVRCHSRQPSATVGLTSHGHNLHSHANVNNNNDVEDADELRSHDCGILGCRPSGMQKFARIKIFVLLLSMLVTLQQALSSGYINSVITTIEKRFEIPSSFSGLIASSYEIGNVVTVIFVSYLGSRRHIPVWIGIGAVIMGIGSLIFMIPHFTGDENPGIALANATSDNICRSPFVRNQEMDLGRLSSGLSNQQLAPRTLRDDNCLETKLSTFGPVLLFVIAQLLLGCGGSPLFTLGTTYIDDHVRTESSSMYIGCMYSMAAFGPVVGFLLGAYLLSFHMDSLSSAIISISPGDRRWVGMWWGGFLLCGVLLIIVAIPFFSFPKVLTHEKKKIRKSSNIQPTVLNNVNRLSEATDEMGRVKRELVAVPTKEDEMEPQVDTGYGKDIKDIPRSMLRLVMNPVYIVTCLGACMELMIVSGFVVFLPKYLETQFSLGKSQASVFTGSVAVPGACIGIFVGGCILKRFQLKPKGAVQFVLVSNIVCLCCYAMLFFLGCDNWKMAGTTMPYYNSAKHTSLEPFQVNLTAACNFGCECLTVDVEPVCGNNGLTYFSPCHAGCTAFSSSSNYTNCACVHSNISRSYYDGIGGSKAEALNAHEDFDEVTVVPVATAGPCATPCRTIYPFLVLLFFMTFIVASTQMPLLMIVLRSVSEEERSFALGMQFVIFRLFGYIPAPILFGNLIDSSCLLWKSACGEKGGRCLIYDIENFRYKYVGLCTSVKIVALAIFIIDWWLVRRRKHLDKLKPLNASDPIIGSIISLDKLFEEKRPVYDPKPNYGVDNDLIIPTEILLQAHNDVRTVHLEHGYDKCSRATHSPANAPATKSKKHFRSASCDVKMMRSLDRDHSATSIVDPNEVSKFRNLKIFKTHSRNNSNDLNAEFRHKRTHARTRSRDDANYHIRYIQNQLKPQEDDEDDELTAGCGHFVKKHSRNHSYDQIYMPNNIRFDPDFCRGHHTKKSVNLLKNMVENKMKNSNEGEGVSRGHSRNNSRDLDVKASTSSAVTSQNVTDSALSILRHRRNNSKDLNCGAEMTSSIATATQSGGGAPQTKHTRTASHQKIQIDDDHNELINNNDEDDDADAETLHL